MGWIPHGDVQILLSRVTCSLFQNNERIRSHTQTYGRRSGFTEHTAQGGEGTGWQGAINTRSPHSYLVFPRDHGTGDGHPGWVAPGLFTCIAISRPKQECQGRNAYIELSGAHECKSWVGLRTGMSGSGPLRHSPFETPQCETKIKRHASLRFW